VAIGDEPSKRPERNNTPLWLGFGISSIWLLVFLVYWYRNHSDIAALAPNNLGDFLAGVFAPLAFLWLFVATLLQRQELALQRQELQETREVMRLQKDELQRSADETREQTAIMKANLQNEARKLEYERVDETLYATALYIYINRDFFILRRADGPHLEIFSRGAIRDASIHAENFDLIFAIVCDGIKQVKELLKNNPKMKFTLVRYDARSVLVDLEERFNNIAALWGSSDNDMILGRLDSMDLGHVASVYSDLLKRIA
jgi:hypothetical protein